MNLKKSFRYQNLISDLIKDALSICFDQANYQTKTALYKKSELNQLSSLINYKDELKDVSKKSEGGFGSSSYSINDFTKKDYDLKKCFAILSYLLDEKVKLSNAIAKAKASVKITPLGFDSSISYDSAVEIAKIYREYGKKKSLLDIREFSVEATATQKIIISQDQPPVDATYHIVTSTEVDKTKKAYAYENCQKANTFAEDLSDKIEAAALSKEIAFTTEIKVTDTFDTLYDNFSVPVE